MRRRRRREQEIGFSFDSFLDVVANVVGVIIRLILVVWVGARSYTALQQAPAPEPPPPAETATVRPEEPPDPLEDELARQRAELARAQAHLLDELRRFQQTREGQEPLARELTGLSARQQALQQERTDLLHRAETDGKTGGEAALSAEEVRQRCGRLAQEIRELEKLPPVKQVLHYQTPVSRPVQAEELMFECRGGRVTFIELASLLGDVKRGLEDKGKQLRTQWSVAEVVGPVGAFRLRYTVERQRGMLDRGSDAPGPSTEEGFRYGLSGWQLEPVEDPRGEPEAVAMAPGSAFRQVADRIDPQLMTVTFWVYSDSFPLYRRLRDYLYERDVVVAGRPLPDGAPIASSRHGTASRGQ
jgi:hypothetical protein